VKVYGLSNGDGKGSRKVRGSKMRTNMLGGLGKGADKVGVSRRRGGTDFVRVGWRALGLQWGARRRGRKKGPASRRGGRLEVRRGCV